MKLTTAIAALVTRLLDLRRRRVGTVTGTSGAKVIVTVDGGSMVLPRLASYTPTVNDLVHIDCHGSWLVLGKTA